MVTVRVDMSKAQRKLSEASVRAGRRAFAEQALIDQNENFVPMRQQYLRDTAIVTVDGSAIIWHSVYAAAQYYGGTKKATFRNYTTPGTGPYWDKKAKSIFMNDWIKAFKKGANW